MRPSEVSADAQLERRLETISGLLARTLDAHRLDDELWALIVTRVFGQAAPANAWLREDDLRLLGGLDSSMCLARTVLPGWRLRLICRPGERAVAYCDRWGCWPGPSMAADAPLAVCAALLRAVLAEARHTSKRRDRTSFSHWLGIAWASPRVLTEKILQHARPEGSNTEPCRSAVRRGCT
jgi:hypothetical protein